MKKILSPIIEAIAWLQLFICPIIIGGLIALFIYSKEQRLLWLAVTVMLVAFVAGILFAERTRKKYGCSRFLSKILSTDDQQEDIGN